MTQEDDKSGLLNFSRNSTEKESIGWRSDSRVVHPIWDFYVDLTLEEMRKQRPSDQVRKR